MNMVPATSNGSARGERIEIIDDRVLSERTRHYMARGGMYTVPDETSRAGSE
jgi:hypothetical protein